MTTLRALECLVALVDHGSVTRAAASLRISQPALSHQIAALERELGTAVAERTGRGVQVTAAGLAVAEEARVSLAAAHRAVRIGLQIAAGAKGTLRIACAETMTAWVLVPVLRRWRSSHSGVAIELSEHANSDQMVELLSSGRVDLAIGPRPSGTHEYLDVLGEEEVVVVASPGHAFSKELAVRFEDLSGEPFVHFTVGNGLAEWIDGLAAQHEVVLDPVVRTRSPRTAAQLAAAGMGVTVVPVSALPYRPPGVVRRLDPLVRRGVVVMRASTSNSLATTFADDLVRRGISGAEAVP
ncbi:LysR family transcriptional regulator [Amycolatopsis sp. NPDC051903]|uniref:LysR family transcriptional regulator n=1 Tax=Amycolatopsis sp. NPDC051903 TaxID=3363936 RepID=UPI0037A512B6